MGQFPRNLPHGENVIKMHRVVYCYNFPTDNAIDFLFSTLNTTPFHYDVLKKEVDSVIRWEVIAIHSKYNKYRFILSPAPISI